MRLLPTILATTALAGSLQAQRSDFHWNKAIAAGSSVSIHNISGDVRVTPRRALRGIGERRCLGQRRAR
jgi:hypothetical protein